MKDWLIAAGILSLPLSIIIGFISIGVALERQEKVLIKPLPITILFPAKDAAEVEWQGCIINLNTKKRTSYIYCPEKE